MISTHHIFLLVLLILRNVPLKCGATHEVIISDGLCCCGWELTCDQIEGALDLVNLSLDGCLLLVGECFLAETLFMSQKGPLEEFFCYFNVVDILFDE